MSGPSRRLTEDQRELNRLRSVIQSVRLIWSRYNLNNLRETEAKIDATMLLTKPPDS